MAPVNEVGAGRSLPLASPGISSSQPSRQKLPGGPVGLDSMASTGQASGSSRPRSALLPSTPNQKLIEQLVNKANSVEVESPARRLNILGAVFTELQEKLKPEQRVQPLLAIIHASGVLPTDLDRFFVANGVTGELRKSGMPDDAVSTLLTAAAERLDKLPEIVQKGQVKGEKEDLTARSNAFFAYSDIARRLSSEGKVAPLRALVGQIKALSPKPSHRTHFEDGKTYQSQQLDAVDRILEVARGTLNADQMAERLQELRVQTQAQPGKAERLFSDERYSGRGLAVGEQLKLMDTLADQHMALSGHSEPRLLVTKIKEEMATLPLAEPQRKSLLGKLHTIDDANNLLVYFLETGKSQWDGAAPAPGSPLLQHLDAFKQLLGPRLRGPE